METEIKDINLSGGGYVQISSRGKVITVWLCHDIDLDKPESTMTCLHFTPEETRKMAKILDALATIVAESE